VALAAAAAADVDDADSIGNAICLKILVATSYIFHLSNFSYVHK